MDIVVPFLDPVPVSTSLAACGRNLTAFEPNGTSVRVWECKTEEEAAQRVAVVQEARTWLQTPYHHLGRVKGAGADCATLLAEVYEAVGVVAHVDIGYYPMDWHLHREAERYLAYINRYMKEVTVSGEPADVIKPGDIVMYKFGRAFSHGAIIIDPGWPNIVHAEILAKSVILGTGNTGRFADREMRFFSLWG